MDCFFKHTSQAIEDEEDITELKTGSTNDQAAIVGLFWAFDVTWTPEADTLELLLLLLNRWLLK